MHRPLSELVNTEEPGIHLVRQWVETAENPCEVLPASANRAEVLSAIQVPTRSPLGAIAYDTGGILVDNGWLRLLGSGHSAIGRDLATWNENRGKGLFLVADDAVGGFFAINGGLLGTDTGNIYYWAPDSLEWFATQLGFSEFLQWSLSSALATFYSDLRWESWLSDVASLPGDRCFAFYPFLWTVEGTIESSHRATVPAHEAYDLKMDIARQMGAGYA